MNAGRRIATVPAAAVLLAGPTVLAFFSGGYFDEPRLVAAIAAWALVVVVALVSPQPLPASRAGRVALAGLAALCAWGALSLLWAPLGSRATDDLMRLLLYLGAFVAAMGLLRERALMRAVEPALALGALVVIGYGIAGRLLPGVVELSASARADGRLEQPLTYWNAEGLLAAMGLVLCARLAADPSRPVAMRVAAAASSPLLGAGVYLSLSRGAMAAAVVGLCVLLAVAPERGQLRAAGLAVAAALIASACTAAFPGVASLEGELADRKTDGAGALALLVLVVLGSALAALWTIRAEQRERLERGRLAFAAALPVVALAVVCLALAGLVAGGLGERGEARVSEGRAERLVSVKSRRYDYWATGISAFGERPLAGVGLGGYGVVWLKERPVEEGAVDAHSLPLETAAELGLVGLLALLAFVGAAGLAARRALRGPEPLLAGAAAAGSVWLVHSAIDWDWELPAVTLPALVAAGALIAASESGGAEPAA